MLFCGCCGQRHAARLCVEPQHHRLFVLRPEAFLHDVRPHPPGRTELRYLLEDVVVAVEEERQARREVVDGQSGVDRRLHVGDPVGQGDRDLLDSAAAFLAEVIAGY